MSERTLVLVKPDGLARGLVGEVLGRIERRGYTIVALQMSTLTPELAGEHYAEHQGKPFFDELVTFITSGPLVAAVIEGPDVVEAWRTMMGATNPIKSVPGTIRGDLATMMGENIAHGSDSAESAEREIGIFFPGL